MQNKDLLPIKCVAVMLKMLHMLAENEAKYLADILNDLWP